MNPNLFKKWPNRLLVALFFILFSANVLSAKDIDISVDFGFKIGYGFTSAFIQNSDQVANSLFQNSFVTGGVSFKISHVDFIGVQIEVLYLRKEFRSESLIGLFDTISIPVLLRGDAPFGLFLMGGFAITAFLTPGLDKRLAPYATSDDFQKLEYDIIGALGYQFILYKKLRMFIETRFIYTINNISHRHPEAIRHYGLLFYTGLVY